MNTRERNEKIEQARSLYFTDTLTQAQIAERIGVSQRTVSSYITDNKWDLLRKRANQMPSIFLEQMYTELEEINNAIAARPLGQRFATREEAEVRRKTMYAIATIKSKQSAGIHTEVLLNFFQSIAQENRDHACLLMDYADKYLVGDMDLFEKNAPIYSLPSEVEATAATDSSD